VLIQRVIDESDYYLLVIGGRYGSVDEAGLGFTEKEYDYATARRKPVMAFLHRNPEKLSFENSEGDPKVREKLFAFRRKVEGAKHVKFWTSADDLAAKVALSFNSFTRNYPSAGWIRADAADSRETLRQLISVLRDVESVDVASGAVATPGTFGLIAIYTLVENGNHNFDRLAESVVDAVHRNEPGTLMFVVHAVPRAPMQRIFYELYRDREAYGEHRRQPWVEKFFSDHRPYVLATNIIELDPQYIGRFGRRDFL
jgi:quinol monooxygenase YgiN